MTFCDYDRLEPSRAQHLFFQLLEPTGVKRSQMQIPYGSLRIFIFTYLHLFTYVTMVQGFNFRLYRSWGRRGWHIFFAKIDKARQSGSWSISSTNLHRFPKFSVRCLAMLDYLRVSGFGFLCPDSSLRNGSGLRVSGFGLRVRSQVYMRRISGFRLRVRSQVWESVSGFGFRASKPVLRTSLRILSPMAGQSLNNWNILHNAQGCSMLFSCCQTFDADLNAAGFGLWHTSSSFQACGLHLRWHLPLSCGKAVPNTESN